MNPDNSKTTPIKVFEAKLMQIYYKKLCKSIKTSSFIEDINTYHLADLLDDTKSFICPFNDLQISNVLHVTVIKKIHDQISTKHPS